jgi:hypothetical protein
MSKSAVNQVIQRAISDAAYRRQLQSNPGKALTGFDLTKDERAAITSGDPSRLTALGVDQRMSKTFALAGAAGAASKSVVGDPTGSNAGGATFIDEASAGSSAAIVSGAVGEGTSGLMAPDGTSFDAGFVSGGEPASSAALEGNVPSEYGTAFPGLDASGSAVRDAHDSGAYSTGSAIRDAHDSAAYAAKSADASAGLTNLQRIEGDLNAPASAPAFDVQTNEAGAGGTAAFDPGAVSGSGSATVVDTSGGVNQMNMRLIEGALDTGGGSAIRDAHDAGAYSSGSAIRDAHDSAAYASKSVADAADSANAINLRRIEGDLNTANAYAAPIEGSPELTAFEGTASGPAADEAFTSAPIDGSPEADAGLVTPDAGGGTQVPTFHESGDYPTE